MKKHHRKQLIILIAVLYIIALFYTGFMIISYANRVVEGFKKERDSIANLVVKWSFSGVVSDVNDNGIVLNVTTFDTPKFLPRKIFPQYSIPILKKYNNGDKLTIELSCNSVVKNKIKIGDKVIKRSGVTWIVIDSVLIDMVYK